MLSPSILGSAALLLSFFTAAQAKPYEIRGVQDPVFHLYLQGLANANNETTAVLGPEDSADTFVIDGTIQSNSTGLYLNIEPNDSASYKRLLLQEEAQTTGWGLEGDTIATTTESEYGRQLNFAVCESTESAGFFDVYFQTGSDLPEGTCTNYVTLHLPCLC